MFRHKGLPPPPVEPGGLSVDRIRCLAAAAAALLVTDGPAGLTMTALRESAGRTTGSYYRRFARWAGFKTALVAH